ncbi:S8 family serine peptidase [Gammaproteobacteria bacterium]|nr:S8 family serine peptidase [Gammaproteobacteria bacterium]
MLNVCKVKLLLVVILSLSVSSVIAAPPEWVEGQLIVKPKAGLSDAQFEKILSKSKGQSVKHLKQIKTHVIKVPPQALEAVMRALSNNPNIDYVEKDMLVAPDAITPDDPSYSSQWHLPKIQAPDAWESSTGSGITVAILDTGVESGHPDLVSNLVPGWNVASNNSDTSPVMSHGTRVAGVVAASSNNSTGVASIAWNAKIMPIRISNESNGQASWSVMAEGFLWAADHGADVANMSYGLSTNSSTINSAAQYLRSKGGLAVVAAGNDNMDRGFSDNPYLITVAATTSSDARASFSNFGANIDVAAPGSSIYTTNTGGGYRSASGTSYASPATAGVVALIMAANSSLSPDDVEGILESSAVDLGNTGWDPLFGHGRVNARNAVLMATQASNSDTQAPAVNIMSPGYNATVSGNVLVDIGASDNTGVSEVVLYANGQVVGTDRTAPYQFSWDSTGVADGNATLTAYAYDAANNTGISSGVTVNVDNLPDNVDTTAPTVSIASPAASSNVISGTVKITVNASDDTGVTDVALYVNGQIAGTDSTAPYEFNWDSTRVADGEVTFDAYAYDAANNKGTSSSVVATVDNLPDVVDTIAPSVAISNLADGSTLSGTVSIDVSASDNVGVTQLLVYIDNRLKCSSADTGVLNCSWNTRKLSGSHSIKAVARDAAGHSSETAISVSIGSSSKGSKGRGKNK